jgi:glutamate synthase (NADPH/NADH) large chain
MVDLIAVGDREAELLHGLVQDHADQTGSLIAAELLADWPTALTRFTHVRPKDLWAVEQARLDGQAKGLTDEQITDHIMEVAAHG